MFSEVFEVAIYPVIGLLVVIVVLLCIPLGQRTALLRVLVGMSAFAVVVYYVAPLLIGLIALSYRYISEHLGWPRTLGVIAGVACLPIFFSVWRSDRRENEAIRAGSIKAFNKRVETYKRDPFNYDHSTAVTTATRIRDGK